MANKSTLRIVSAALIVIGIGLASWGYDISGTLDTQLEQSLTGSASNEVMFLYIAGTASFVVGLFLLIKNK